MVPENGLRLLARATVCMLARAGGRWLARAGVRVLCETSFSPVATVRLRVC